MSLRRATYTNYQARASAFKVGDRVYSVLFGNPANGGTVVAVWPAIGMVDVSYPYGVARVPVEDLLIDISEFHDTMPDIRDDSVPGGTHTVSVPGGPSSDSLHRVASQYVKRAVYWAAKNRQYRPSRLEVETGKLCCPRCDEAYLRKTIYKMENGASVKLFVCPECLFVAGTI
jgi:hypothetical protein